MDSKNPECAQHGVLRTTTKCKIKKNVRLDSTFAEIFNETLETKTTTTKRN